jgi:hypothetical protein
MLLRVIAALTESLAHRVGLLDPAEVPADEAKRLVHIGTKLERLGHALRLAGTARMVATGTWQGEGDKSAAAWVARTTGTSMSDAIGTVTTAEQLENLPGTAEAVRRGDLSPEQAKEVAGAATADPSAEGRLLDQAAKGSINELRNEARRTRAAADPDPEATHRRIHKARHARERTDSDGTWSLTLRGTPMSGARIMAGLRHRSDAIFREAHSAGRREPAEAYLFDAAEELLSDPSPEPEAPPPRHKRTPLPKGANAKIIVRVDWSALVRGRVADGEVCEIAGVGPVPVSLVREMCDEDAFLAAVLTKGTDICSVTHLGRRFTALQVTALQWRDPECSRLGCANTVRLEIDHRKDWAQTHVTEVDESDRYCHDDHKLKTEKGWALVEGTGKRPMVPPDHPDHPLQVARDLFARAGPPT